MRVRRAILLKCCLTIPDVDYMLPCGDSNTRITYFGCMMHFVHRPGWCGYTPDRDAVYFSDWAAVDRTIPRANRLTFIAAFASAISTTINQTIEAAF